MNKRKIALCLALLAPLVMALTACGGGKKTETGPLPAAADVLSQATQAFDTMTTFHFLLEHENGTSPIPAGLQIVTAEGDVIVPDRLYAKLDARAGTQPVRVEVIGVGDDGWLTNPFTRQWQPLPSGTTIKDIFNPTEGIKAAIGSLQDAQVTGAEEVGGVQTYHLTGTVTSDVLQAAAPIAKPGLIVPVELWIGKDDHLIRRIYLNGPIAPDEPGNIVRKLTISNFGEQVTITPPA
ncbi:MAG: LppX_LprAFG lipoprotein [Dehalococcoidia bacterium]|jgi:lipoprotein LprG